MNERAIRIKQLFMCYCLVKDSKREMKWQNQIVSKGVASVDALGFRRRENRLRSCCATAQTVKL